MPLIDCPNADVPVRMMVSENTKAYYEYWLATLHRNNCNIDGITSCRCYEGAVRLVKDRLACILRGMPDLTRYDEDRIWKLAFQFHAKHASTTPITPPWAVDQRLVCACFERAQVELIYQDNLKEHNDKIKSTIITAEDYWYEQRFE